MDKKSIKNLKIKLLLLTYLYSLQVISANAMQNNLDEFIETSNTMNFYKLAAPKLKKIANYIEKNTH